MGLIWTVIIGFVAGLISRFIMPGNNEPSGFILTTLLGIVGAFVASCLGQTPGLYGPNEGTGRWRDHRACRLGLCQPTQHVIADRHKTETAMSKSTPSLMARSGLVLSRGIKTVTSCPRCRPAPGTMPPRRPSRDPVPTKGGAACWPQHSVTGPPRGAALPGGLESA